MPSTVVNNIGTVMIVEDDIFSAKLLQRTIEKLGYKVVGNVESAEEAIGLFKETLPDLVIVDFELPGEMDGGDLTNELSKIEKKAIIFITSADDDESLNKIMASKPDGFIQKPFQFRELRAVLELVFYKSEKEAELAAILKDLDNKVKERTKELDEAVQSLVMEMSERETAQRKLEEALQAEKKFGKLKSSIISNLSHEFKTPLSTIRSSAQFLTTIIARQKFDRLDTKHTERIEKAVDDLTALLTRILMVEEKVDKIYDVRIEQFDLSALMDDILQEAKLADCKQCKVDYQYDLDEKEINSDPRLLKLIIANILSNACKYSPIKGQVHFRLAKESDRLKITVNDNGIGMSKNDVEQIFYRFFRGENVESIEGTGIGMSIMKRCLDALGGTVDVESELGKGSTFSLNIPVKNKS